MHNLFGDTDSMQVEPTADGGYTLTQLRRGDTVDSVLRFVNFEPDDLRAAYRAKVGAITGLDETQRRALLAELEGGLEGYTYLED